MIRITCGHAAASAEHSVSECLSGGMAERTPLTRWHKLCELGETVRIADCAQLRRPASLPSCSDGDAFLTAPTGTDRTHDMTRWKACMTLRIGADGPGWKTPRITATTHAPSAGPPDDAAERILLATPGAAGPTAMAHAVSTVSLTYTPTAKDVQDRIRTAAALLGPSFTVDFPGQRQGDPALDGVRRALPDGVTAVLLLLVAFGTPASYARRIRSLADGATGRTGVARRGVDRDGSRRHAPRSRRQAHGPRLEHAAGDSRHRRSCFRRCDPADPAHSVAVDAGAGPPA